MYFFQVLTGTQKKDLYHTCYKCDTQFSINNYNFSCRVHRHNKKGKCIDCISYLTKAHHCYHIIKPSIFQRIINFLKLK